MPENIESFSHTETPLQFQVRAYEILQERFAELTQANKALSLQNEVLSGAYETAEKRVKDLGAEMERIQAEQSGLRQAFSEAKMEIVDLEADRAELLDFLENIAYPQRGSDAEKWNLVDVTSLATHLLAKHRFEPAEQPLPDGCQDTLSFVGGCAMPPGSCKKCAGNPADLDEV